MRLEGKSGHKKYLPTTVGLILGRHNRYRTIPLHSCAIIDKYLNHMQYLENNHCYLFSLAMRTNPFDHEASIVMRQH